MTDTSAITPAGRALAVFEPEPQPALRCSHCGSVITDDDSDCPTCTSPLDWGASVAALRAWQKSVAGDAPPG